jgi:hypothetical protein
MGIFNFFRKPIILQHPELGTLYFDKSGHYQTMLFFEPALLEVELFINGSKAGISPYAMMLYKWL